MTFSDCAVGMLQRFRLGHLTLIWCVVASAHAQSTIGQGNLPIDEQRPIIGPDQKTLYFTMANHPSNKGGEQDKGDIWISTRLADSKWTDPVHADDRLNSLGYEALAGISQDGNRLYLVRSCNSVGRSKELCFALTQRVGEGENWSAPKPIRIPYINGGLEGLSGYATPDERVLLFSGAYYGSLGAEDLYVILRDRAGKWGEPKNLGLTINTAMQEITPWLDEGKRFLYFASNGRRDGYGSFDVYRAERLDESWTSWSTPVNMGPEVNSTGMEASYSAYPAMNKAIYVSTVNSDGYGDVKTIDLPSSPIATTQDSSAQEAISIDSTLLPPDATPAPVSWAAEPVPDKLIIHGSVKEESTDKALEATLLFIADSASFTATANRKGDFEAALPYVKTYRIEASAFGYAPFAQMINVVDSGGLAEYTLSVTLKPLESGATVNLENVLFKQGTDTLLAGSFAELDKVAAFMRDSPNTHIQLAGYTDNRGIAAQNIALSKQRVARVQEYLIDKGIGKGRISGDGYGGAKPIASNSTEETRKLNRRVEFTIIREE